MLELGIKILGYFLTVLLAKDQASAEGKAAYIKMLELMAGRGAEFAKKRLAAEGQRDEIAKKWEAELK